jgi:hypothetical protein
MSLPDDAGNAANCSPARNLGKVKMTRDRLEAKEFLCPPEDPRAGFTTPPYRQPGTAASDGLMVAKPTTSVLALSTR